MYVLTYVRMYVCMYVCMYIYICIHIHIYIYTCESIVARLGIHATSPIADGDVFGLHANVEGRRGLKQTSQFLEFTGALKLTGSGLEG